MNQLAFFEPPSWTVTDLTSHIRDLIENDEDLQDLWVLGEVSNLSRPTSGHLYFTLKDKKSALRCVMWRSFVERLMISPRNGDAIEVHGNINIYEASGQYQLYADLIRPAGEGDLYQEFLRLKALLEAEGLFELERKRPIPEWPHKIGVISSPTGAAIRDILNTIQRRYTLANIVLAPTPVQGGDAPAGIVNALEALNQFVKADVILLARGGGSIEDLWAFNDERVARAIVASQAPVICGVGHETDFTIADFVSDVRAATPTAAAELATPNRLELSAGLTDLNHRMGRALESVLISQRWELERRKDQLLARSPQARVRSGRQHLDDLTRRAEYALKHNLQIQRALFNSLDQRLSSLNPYAVLKRGFAVVTLAGDQVVRSVKQVKPGDAIDIQVQDGRFGAQVKKDG